MSSDYKRYASHACLLCAYDSELLVILASNDERIRWLSVLFGDVWFSTNISLNLLSVHKLSFNRLYCCEGWSSIVGESSRKDGSSTGALLSLH